MEMHKKIYLSAVQMQVKHTMKKPTKRRKNKWNKANILHKDWIAVPHTFNKL